MSDSTRDAKPGRSSEPGLLQDRRGRWDRLWWMVSLILHLGAYGAILYFSPLRTIIFTDSQPEEFKVTADAGQISQVIEDIRDFQAMEAAWKVDEILAIQYDLEQLRDAKFDQFEEFAGEFAKDAPTLALEAQQQALRPSSRPLRSRTRPLKTRARWIRSKPPPSVRRPSLKSRMPWAPSNRQRPCNQPSRATSRPRARRRAGPWTPRRVPSRC